MKEIVEDIAEEVMELSEVNIERKQRGKTPRPATAKGL